ARVKDRIARTRRPEVIGDVGQVGGLFAAPGTDKVLVATTDGVGTKLEVARLLDRHEVVGADLVNHCVNDALAMGAEPLFFLDYFATSKIDPAVFSRVVGAMADACARFGVTLLGGETAEMPGMYAPDTYDLAGFLVGVVDRGKVLGPERAREGDLPRALPEGTGAWIDSESWEVPAVFSLLAKLGDLEDLERFDTWNMGIGLVVAVAADSLDAALAAVPDAVALGRVIPHSSGRRVIFG